MTLAKSLLGAVREALGGGPVISVQVTPFLKDALDELAAARTEGLPASSVAEALAIEGETRWLLGDLDHFLIRLRRGGAAALPAALRDLRRTRQGRALDFDTLRRDDPRPFLHECRRWLFGAARRRR